MDGEQFDSIVRALATASRRSALRSLAGGALTAAGLAGLGLEAVAGRCASCGRSERCCGGKCRDVTKNEKHCGRCGKRCGKGEQCKRGKCRGASCAPPTPVDCRQQLPNPKSRCCTENSPVCCRAGSFVSCCPASDPHCCPPRDQGFNVPCCPPERPNCCAGPGGCCADGFECTPEGCVRFIPPPG